MQIWCGEAIEQENLFIARNFSGKKAIASPRIIHASNFFVFGRHGVLQAQQGIYFRIKNREVSGTCAASAILQVGFHLCY